MVMEIASGTRGGSRLAALEPAANGKRAEAAYSHVGFTSFSIKNLFTGWPDPAPGEPSLGNDFLANGYDVGIFSGQSEDFGGIAETTGMHRASNFVDANTLRDENAFSLAAKGLLYVDGRIVLRKLDRHLGNPESWQTPQFLQRAVSTGQAVDSWTGFLFASIYDSIS